MSGEAVLGDGRVRPDWTMTHLVRARAREHGRRVFATFEGGAALTFAGLDRESDRFAAALAACEARADCRNGDSKQMPDRALTLGPGGRHSPGPARVAGVD